MIAKLLKNSLNNSQTQSRKSYISIPLSLLCVQYTDQGYSVNIFLLDVTRTEISPGVVCKNQPGAEWVLTELKRSPSSPSCNASHQGQHTNHNFAIYFLQDEASLVAQLCRLSTQHPNEPFLPQIVISEPEFKELLKNILGRVVFLEKADMVKKNLEENKRTWVL